MRVIFVPWKPGTGDTLSTDSLPVSTLAPVTSVYASAAEWYVNNEPITVGGRPYRRNGLPHVVGDGDVVKVGEFRGVGVYAEVADTAVVRVYLPTRPGCEFQPYVDVDSMLAFDRWAAHPEVATDAFDHHRSPSSRSAPST
ncbi:hypothetical protein [Longimicrobium sp.]|uniref:hypothetical protein n=1 Tax=Longimicrobium sp. TaxID=2029185 RepID=UPI003B3BE1B0